MIDKTPRSPLATESRTVICPRCNGQAVYSPSNRYRPFCSARCKQIDLGAWANEEFRVPSEQPPEDEIYGDPKRED